VETVDITGPLFKWFGSKWLSSRLLPAPLHTSIVEPFAGSAGYSLRHCRSDVSICEIDKHISRLWQWLIGDASESTIRDIPIDIPVGTDIRTLPLSIGQKLLLKTWQRTNNVGDCWTISPWGNSPGQWTANTRSRVANEVGAVKHWKILPDGLSVLVGARNGGAATWMIDPPYQYNYQYRGTPIDYVSLAESVKLLKGQIIVTEAICQKTGKVPDWLPFVFFGDRITSRRKKNENHHSKELIWECREA
jgi:hypothetical protein